MFLEGEFVGFENGKFFIAFILVVLVCRGTLIKKGR